MSGYGAGIRRGPMAADHFTQIRNDLFRDPAISFKAKGLFGLISTHRDGWRVSAAQLAQLGPDGKDAVTSGLKELEKHGYLVRERQRRPDGTLGEIAYFITDIPERDEPRPSASARSAAAQIRRSQPESEIPAQAEPAQADPHTKNTKRKNTTDQNTNPVRPSVRNAHAHESGVDPCPAHDTPEPAPQDPATKDPSAGARLLLAIGAHHPELLLTGKALSDQGQILTLMLDAGWTPEQLQHVIAGRPLPHPIRTSVGAIIAARLRAAQAYPPPAVWAHHTDTAKSSGRSTTASADLTVSDALTYRALVECSGCGKPGTAPGEDLCPECLNWPLCRTCSGPTPRRAHPSGDGRCTTCATAFTPR
ncbi:hypothetical protein [Streptomyces sp. NPDC059909]|uniref:hypothetical protein n=1 Tax=Streptomyces sp. NPDC059909 TaxID=3346998 RepID=UPI00364F97B5